MCGQQQHENTRASQCKPDHQDSSPKSTSAVMSKHSMLWQITGWPVVAIVVSILIGIGVGVMSMSPPDFVVAKSAFALAAAILDAKVAHWSAKSKTGAMERMIMTFLIFGTVGLLVVESWRWVDHRRLLRSEAVGRTSSSPSSPLPETERKPSQTASTKPHKAPSTKPEELAVSKAMPKPIGARLGTGPEAYKDISDEQVGEWAMQEADKINEMAKSHMMRFNLSKFKPNASKEEITSFNNFQLAVFTRDFNECCAQDVKDLRTEILRRLGPPFKNQREESTWKEMFSQEMPPRGVPPPAWSVRINPILVSLYAPYLRRLGMKLKWRNAPKIGPMALHFSQEEKAQPSGNCCYEVPVR